MEHKLSYFYDGTYMIGLFALYLINTLTRSEWAEVFIIGEISLYALFVVIYFLLLKTWLFQGSYPLNYRPAYLAVIVLMLYISYSFTSSQYIETEEYIQLLFHFLFILAVIRICFYPLSIKIAGMMFSLTVVVLFIHWITSEVPLQGFKSIYGNENYLAVFLFSLLYFQVIAQHYTRRSIRSMIRLTIALNFLLIVATGARSVIIGIGIALITALCIKYYPSMLRKLFHIVMLGSLAFVGLYVAMSFTGPGEKLNDTIYELTGKNLFSGRQEIWELVIDAIFDKPVFGHGLGVQAYDVAGTDLTSHNMYLQTMLEFGLVGFGLFYLLLFTLWRLLIVHTDSFATRCSLSFMAGILVYNTFELTLLQNNYSIAVFQWTIMTIGIGFIDRKSQEGTTGEGKGAYVYRR